MSPPPSKSLIWSHEPITSPPEMPAIGNFHQLPDATMNAPMSCVLPTPVARAKHSDTKSRSKSVTPG